MAALELVAEDVALDAEEAEAVPVDAAVEAAELPELTATMPNGSRKECWQAMGVTYGRYTLGSGVPARSRCR